MLQYITGTVFGVLTGISVHCTELCCVQVGKSQVGKSQVGESQVVYCARIRRMSPMVLDGPWTRLTLGQLLFLFLFHCVMSCRDSYSIKTQDCYRDNAEKIKKIKKPSRCVCTSVCMYVRAYSSLGDVAGELVLHVLVCRSLGAAKGMILF